MVVPINIVLLNLLCAHILRILKILIYFSITFVANGFSYVWYTTLGALVAIGIGLLISFIFKRNDPRDVDSTLLSPFIRKLIKPRLFPNQPDGNEIIYAYERKVHNIISLFLLHYLLL